MGDLIEDTEETEEAEGDDKTNYRLSRKVDAVGFFDIDNPNQLMEFWQMHTPPAVGDSVLFYEETSMPEAVGEWQVISRQWHCFDGPFTVVVYVKKIY